MGNLSAQDKYDLARWNPTVLLSVFAAQIIVSIQPMAFFIKTLITWGRLTWWFYLLWYCVGLVVSFATFILVIVECYKFKKQTLTPGFMVATSITKTTLAVASLAFNIASAILGFSRTTARIVCLVMTILLVILTLVTSVYSLRVYRRTVNYTGQPLTNKAYEFHQRSNSDLESATYDTPKDISSSYRSITSLASLSSKRSSNPERPPSPCGAAPESEIPRLYGPRDSESTGSLESPSISSEATLGSPTIGTLPPTPMTPMTVYTHERDTQFDQYMAQRKSQVLATPTSPQSPARSSHRRSTASAITSLPILATPEIHAQYNPLTPPTSPGRPVVPIVIISPSRRTSGGLEIVLEEAEGRLEEPEPITRPRKDSIGTRKTRKETQAAEEVGLLREVDLNDGNTTTNRKRAWDGAIRP